MGRKGGAKKGGGKGRSISNVKKSNLKRHKLVKAGKLKPKSNPRFVEGGHLKKKSDVKKPAYIPPEELEAREKLRKEEAKQWEDEAYAEMADMMDPEDLAYLKQVHEQKKSKAKKQKQEDDEDVDEYESKVLERHNRQQTEEEIKQKTQKALLPIRNKDGKWVNRVQEVEADDDADSGDDSASDKSDDDSDKEVAPARPISVVEIMAKRRKLLTEAKIQIGSMANSYLEQPEERLHILQRLIRMMGGKSKESGVDVTVQQTVIKLASASLLEIFKDTLPNYKILEHEDKAVKLKKDTLKLHRYESGLLGCVKSYLVRLSKSVRAATGKGVSPHVHSAGKYSLQCLCSLFVAHPNFNFTNHIVPFLVPYLNSGDQEFRSLVCSTLEDVFRGDKKGEVSFIIVKQINHFLKTKKKGSHHKIHTDVLMPLLCIKLYHLNNNRLTENDEATKNMSRPNLKGVSKKNKHLVEPILSKKEKKRIKERAKLDRELLEAKGEESTKSRLRFATDITNLLFAIYFRILKSFTANHQTSGTIKLLHPVLNGLAKFGHLMSIEYFQDVLSAFKVLIGEESVVPIKNYEKLLCLKTVFSILSGQGDHLTLDPAKFYVILNQILLQLDLNDDQVYSTLRDREYFAKSRQSVLAVAVLKDALIERRKKISKSTVASIIKSVSMAMLHQAPDATLGMLKFIRECIFVAHPQLSSILVLEGEAEEDGSILPTSAVHLPATGEKDPFGLSSGQSLMWEAALLANHVSPQVAEAAQELLAKKSGKPMKRPLPLSIPTEVKAETDGEEIDENSCFEILNSELPIFAPVGGKKRRVK